MSSGLLPVLVTTSGKLSRRDQVSAAKGLAQRLGLPFVPNQRGVPAQALLSQASAVLVVKGDGVTLVDAAGQARWSPGLGLVRVKRLDDAVDQPDGVLVAGEVRAGDQLLDCTLGLGQDALVLARAVGPSGRVVGVEASAALWAFVRAGLEEQGPLPRSCSVETRQAEAGVYLRSLPDQSFDCVYFDPMFSRPSGAQPTFALLRRHAESAPLSRGLLEEAQRVARRWVVVKAAAGAGDLHRLGLAPLPFRKTADLRFGRLPGRLHHG